jgi:arylsulfatase A-like enzyme/formylglycine-generating enzyme required for sulfatase activity
MTGLWPARTGITVPGCHVEEVVLEKAGLLDRRPPGVRTRDAVFVTRLKTEYRTLAEELLDAGYVTGHFGKWHLGRDPYNPQNQGFDVDVPHTFWPGPPPYVAPWTFPKEVADHFAPRVPDEHLEDRMADEAASFIEANRDRPFYLNYWAFSVHGPWNGKTNLIEHYRALAKPDSPQRNPVYAAMVHSLDDAVGRLIDTLDRLRLTDNTIVVFTSDNGGYDHPARNGVEGDIPVTSNAPLRAGKGCVYEGGVRVPLLVAWPGHIAPGSVSEELAQSVDWYPTFLDALGIAPKDGQAFDGASLLPALKGGRLARDAIYCHFPHGGAIDDSNAGSVVWEGDWKLLRLYARNADMSDRHELYNLRDDLSETTDLAARHPERVRALSAKLDRFLAASQAVIPEPNPFYRDLPADHPLRAEKQRLIEKDRAEALAEKLARQQEQEKAMKIQKERFAAIVAAASLRLASNVLGDSAVTDVTFAQRPGSRDVDIAYTLSGGPAIVTLAVETNGVPLPDSAVTWLEGDVSKLVQPGRRAVVWHAGKDWPEHAAANARARILAWHPDTPPPYAVVDLIGGPAAPGWPVTYHPSVEALPYGGLSNDLYRTTRLVLKRIRTHAPPPEDGVFLMGSPANETGRTAASETLHPVRLTRDFYIGVFEVTQGQYQQALSDLSGTLPWPAAYNHRDSRRVRPVESLSYNKIRSAPSGAADPLVDWPANANVGSGTFLGRLREKTGVAFDLPTEAQWEYAARAGASGALTDGTASLTNAQSDARLDTLGRYASNGGLLWNAAENKLDYPETALGVTKADIGPEYASATAGTYAPNAWGLYDVHGNVFEWVLDRHTDTFDPASEAVDPVGSTGASDTNRVLRSGTWNLNAATSRLAYRRGTQPAWQAINTGFRVTFTLPPPLP